MYTYTRDAQARASAPSLHAVQQITSRLVQHRLQRLQPVVLHQLPKRRRRRTVLAQSPRAAGMHLSSGQKGAERGGGGGLDAAIGRGAEAR